MTRVFILLFALALCNAKAYAQTNCHFFALPPSQLRGILPEGKSSEDQHAESRPLETRNLSEARAPNSDSIEAIVTTESAPPANPTNQVFLSSSGFTPTGAAVYERLSRQGFFTRRETAPNPFDQFFETVFAPKVFHLGRLDLSCSVLTAIQRQNPLCLLNPIFFQLAW